MSILDNEDKIFNDIEEKTFDIIIEEDHTPDYHQAWWDILGYVLNNDDFSRIIKADVLLTYKQSFWPYEINGFGTVPTDKASWINIILNKKKYFGITVEKINCDLRHLKFASIYDTRLIALDSYISTFMSDSPLDSDLFDETKRHSILYQLFNMKYVGYFGILYNRGWFRDNFIIDDEKVVISKYKEYLEKILYKLRKKNININIDDLNSFILSRFNKGIK